MDIAGRVAVVTGAGSGIGRALAESLHRAGAALALCDIDEAALRHIAGELGAEVAAGVDVADEAALQGFISDVEAHHGRIDLFCSNAGIAIDGDPWTPEADWDRIWRVNVLSHVYAARHVLPAMLERKEGYLLQTASAAGLLSQIGSAPYAVTKHAVVALAEWLAITYGTQGIKVTVLAPQGVRTKMTENAVPGSPLAVAGVDGMLEPSEVAAVAVEAIREERFLALPHPEVETYLQRKVADYDRWIRGMQRLQTQFGLDP
jgi:NAD(P)-dependent dehydrogenase (short-subunit alcohol dehydrogenase family)